MKHPRWKEVELETVQEPGVRRFWYWHRGSFAKAQREIPHALPAKVKRLNQNGNGKTLEEKDLRVFVGGREIKLDFEPMGRKSKGRK